jgi:hypothetical protein
MCLLQVILTNKDLFLLIISDLKIMATKGFSAGRSQKKIQSGQAQDITKTDTVQFENQLYTVPPEKTVISFKRQLARHQTTLFCTTTTSCTRTIFSRLKSSKSSQFHSVKQAATPKSNSYIKSLDKL